MASGFGGLDEFWPFYIAQHMNRANRRLHFAGTTFGLVALAACMLLREPRLIPIGLAGAYGLAWIGHFKFEGNKPATFRYPFLSFRADLRMYRLMWTGSMEAEIIRLKQQILPYR
ncbi:MAG: DUF962 domain-containing protein [Elusimicrobia bacterium]|nr:DUF962 domain-containing protein [Elusimicrobiota bacterium]